MEPLYLLESSKTTLAPIKVFSERCNVTVGRKVTQKGKERQRWRENQSHRGKKKRLRMEKKIP